MHPWHLTRNYVHKLIIISSCIHCRFSIWDTSFGFWPMSSMTTKRRETSSMTGCTKTGTLCRQFAIRPTKSLYSDTWHKLPDNNPHWRNQASLNLVDQEVIKLKQRYQVGHFIHGSNENIRLADANRTPPTQSKQNVTANAHLHDSTNKPSNKMLQPHLRNLYQGSHASLHSRLASNITTLEKSVNCFENENKALKFDT